MGKPSKPRSQHGPQLRLVQLGESAQQIEPLRETPETAKPLVAQPDQDHGESDQRINGLARDIAEIMNNWEQARREKRNADRRRQRAAKKARMQQESGS